MHLLKNSKYLTTIRDGTSTNKEKKKKLPLNGCISRRHKINYHRSKFTLASVKENFFKTFSSTCSKDFTGTINK